MSQEKVTLHSSRLSPPIAEGTLNDDGSVTWEGGKVPEDRIEEKSYEIGFRDGTNDLVADWSFALDEAGIELEPYPGTVVSALAAARQRIADQQVVIVTARSVVSGYHADERGFWDAVGQLRDLLGALPERKENR